MDDETTTGEERSRSRERGSGWSRGLGMLTALKEALEQSIAEARERGDLSPERAREVFDAAAARARDFTAEARDRLDFVPRAEFDALARRVADLEARRSASEGPGAEEAAPEP